jgi:hypothetical protein
MNFVEIQGVYINGTPQDTLLLNLTQIATIVVYAGGTAHIELIGGISIMVPVGSYALIKEKLLKG